MKNAFSFKLKLKVYRSMISWLLVILCGGLVAGYQLPDEKLHLFFLDIGQGDSILIRTPENHKILIDGGPGNLVVRQLAEILPFFDKKIDLMILTHPHEDHVAGLVEVLKRFEVEHVLITAVNYENTAYDELLREIDLQGIDLLTAKSSEDFVLGSVFLDVLYPFGDLTGRDFENVNNSSIVLKLYHEDLKVLMTGDLEVEGEEALIASGEDLEANILKAGHHGSRTASSADFLKKVGPEVVVIQCGKDNQFGHPHPETLRNLYRANVESIRRTDEEGRVHLQF